MVKPDNIDIAATPSLEGAMTARTAGPIKAMDSKCLVLNDKNHRSSGCCRAMKIASITPPAAHPANTCVGKWTPR